MMASHGQQIPKATQQYLNRYAEYSPLKPQVQAALETRDFALVIPAYKEDFAFIARLAKRPDAGQILLLLILNEPDSDLDNQENIRLIETLQKDSEFLAEDNALALYRVGNLMVLTMSRTGKDAIPARQGVGLARKIGADLACSLFVAKKIRQPWIFSSDADATLSKNHFLAACDTRASAYYYPFRHIGGDIALHEATQVYERCLHYYQNQLDRAGSPYAFHTLGSAMAVSMPHYCQARGFPKRAGGEDFYLLNKLAKLAPVHFAKNCTVEIAARVSDRVPFGTGPAVKRILEQQASGHAPHYYAPVIFVELKKLLANAAFSWKHPEAMQNTLSSAAWQALQDAGFDTFLAKRKQQDKSEAQFIRHFHRWFDAFQTLKFIHRLQLSYPDIPVEAITEDLIYN